MNGTIDSDIQFIAIDPSLPNLCLRILDTSSWKVRRTTRLPECSELVVAIVVAVVWVKSLTSLQIHSHCPSLLDRAQSKYLSSTLLQNPLPFSTLLSTRPPANIHPSSWQHTPSTRSTTTPSPASPVQNYGSSPVSPTCEPCNAAPSSTKSKPSTPATEK